MRIKIIQLFCFLLVVLFSTFGIASDKRSFKAELSGSEMLKHVKTDAKGEAEFKLSENGDEMTYELTVKDAENITAAHIHIGKKGEEGPPVVLLFIGPKKGGKFSGKLSEGTITKDNLEGQLKGKPLKSLIQIIDAENAYVKVHTYRYPNGEIRGQIK